MRANAVVLGLVLPGCIWIGKDERQARLDADGDGVLWPEDCDDADPSVGLPPTWALDADGDGVAGPERTDSCTAPSAFVAPTELEDCDDLDADVHPGAVEACNAVDDDCDVAVDEDLPTTTWHADEDRDGTGDAAVSVEACQSPDGMVADGRDCNDADASVSPDRDEVVYDGLDNDCDPSTSDDDADGDGHAATFMGGGDCDDDDDRVYPGAPETPGDGIDQDCSGSDLADADLDGVPVDEDCDDTDPSIYPGAPESCFDLRDHDCDGLVRACTTADADLAITGVTAGDYAGHAVIFAGDVNGDGADDALVGSWAESSVSSQSGAAWLMAGPITADTSLADAHATIRGSSAALRTGHTLGRAGDLDGDGYDDVLVGSEHDYPKAFVLHGPLTGVLDVSTQANGVVDAGYKQGTGRSAMLPIGDQSGDGLTDLLIGAGGCCGGAGRVYIVPGPGESTSLPATVLTGAAAYDNFGEAIAVVDLDGDGVDDAVVGAPSNSYGSGGGDVWAFQGPLTAARDAVDADLRITAEGGADRMGSAVAGGDVNGDGHADLVVGAHGADHSAADAGSVYVLLGPLSGSGAVSGASVARFDGEGAGDAVGSHAGRLRLGDLDADGDDDLLVSVAEWDDDRGRVYLLAGPMSGVAGLGLADGVLDGEPTGGRAGGALDVGGDLNGDGVGDLLVGAALEDVGGEAGAGVVWLFSGVLR